MTSRRKQALKNCELKPDFKKKSRLREKVKGRLVDEDDKDVEGDTHPTRLDSKNVQSTRSQRGRTKMHCLSLLRSLGIKKDVEFNELGQPIGQVASQMQSYIGVLAREKVKITYDSWKNVPIDVKELIWESVNLSFNVDQIWKGACLYSASTKWRQFKTKLTNEFVYGKVDSPELSKPPAEYPCIQPADWSAFVISRLSNNFLKLREQQQKRRSHYVHPYRFSRKGYARYADENPELLCDDAEINQATLWVEGRKPKDGIHQGDDLREKVTKIEEFISKKKSGTLQGRECTILESALEKEEHRGRLRGVGGHVTQTTYYNVPRKSKFYTEFCSQELQELMDKKKRHAEQLTEQEARIARLEAILYKTGAHNVDTEEKSSRSVNIKGEMNDEIPQTEHDVNVDDVDMHDRDEDVQILDKNAQFMGKHVVLSSESDTNIAGYDTVVNVHRPNEQLPKNCMRVDTNEAVDENAPLPIPTGGCHNIGDVVGSHISWQKPKRNKNQERKLPTVDFSTIPMSLRMVYCYCKASLARNNKITINLDDGVFGDERTVYVHFEDVEPFCQLQPIPYTCIAVYIWHLYKELRKSDKVNKFRFVDPWNIGHIPYMKKDKKTNHEKMEQRARELARRLSGTLTSQIVLVPCNVGEHWILTVVDPHKEEIGLLDPLYNGNRDGAWKQVVERAIKMFNAEMGRKGKKTLAWRVIKAPKQPDYFQCGYYVMRYMREIVKCDPFETIGSLQLLFSKGNYSDADINEVRSEWAEFVQEYIFE